jgi:hypothetical protein
VQRTLGRAVALLDDADQRPHDLDERDVLARLPRQRLVDEGDAPDASHGLLDRVLRFGVGQTSALEAEQARDRLEVVLHPVMDLADRGVLRHEQPIPATQLRDVADEADDAGHRVVSLDQGEEPDDDRGLASALHLGRG